MHWFADYLVFLQLLLGLKDSDFWNLPYFQGSLNSARVLET